MAFYACIIAIAAFLSVIAAVVFVMLVIGIRKGDRARHLSEAPESVLDALTRSFLGVGVRRGDHEKTTEADSEPGLSMRTCHCRSSCPSRAGRGLPCR